MKKLVGFGIVALIALILLGNSVVIVGAGQRGVVLTWGKVSNTVWGEGLHFKMPIMQSVATVSVQILKTEADAAAASKDLQQTDSKIVLNYHLIPDKVNQIYQSIGIGYEDVIIRPLIQEIVKNTTAKYNAVELITQRETVRLEIQTGLTEKLRAYNMIVDNFNIVHFSFSQQFEAAIEQKQTAEQNALKANRDLERIKIEAEQKIATAQAEAASLKMQKEQVTPAVLQLRWIEKWDGKLPEVQAGNGMIPMINLNK
jgi:regulator of protease activity HflC (stomatin/prohibitin superfamily)